MNAKIYQRVELAFWDFTIQTLSESKFARSLVRNTYNLVKGSDSVLTRKRLALIAICGLVVGTLSGAAVFISSLYL